MMDRNLCRILICGVFVLLPFLVFAEENLTEYTQPVSRYDRYELLRREIIAIDDRHENRPGAQTMLNFLVQYAQDRNIDWRIHDIERRGTFHSFGKNVSYFVPGDQDSQLVFFVPYISSAENSNEALIAALLSILDNPDSAGSRSHIEICFLGSVDENKGIQEYLNRIQVTPPNALFYLTSHETLGDTVLQENGDRGNITPLWIVRNLSGLLRTHGLSDKLRYTQLYRMGLPSSNAIAPLLEAELNAVSLMFEPPSQSPSLDIIPLRFVSDLLLNTTAEAESIDTLRQGDRHYVSIDLGKNRLFITEGQYIAVVLSILLLLISSLTFLRKQRQKMFNAVYKNMVPFMLLVGAMFVSVLVGSLMAELTGIIRNVENLLLHTPVSLFFFRVLFTGTVFAGFALAIQRLLLARIPFKDMLELYAAAAVIICWINLIIFTILNINFAHYFLWTVLCSFLLWSGKKRGGRILWLLLAILPLLPLLITMLGNRYFPVQLMNNAVSANLITAGILLPLAFLVMACKRQHTAKKGVLVVSFLLPSLLSMIMVFLAKPFTADNPQEITISALHEHTEPFFTEDTQASLEEEDRELLQPFRIGADSDAALGNFTINFLNIPLRVESRNREYEFPVRTLPANLHYRGKKQTFFDRSSYTVILASDVDNLHRISIDLYTGKNNPIYNANFPYEFTAESGRIRFLTGINPPDPLILEFIIPSNIQPRLEIDALYQIEDDYRLIPDSTRSFTLLSRERITFDSQFGSSDNANP